VQKEYLVRSEKDQEGIKNALVRITPLQMIRARGKG